MATNKSIKKALMAGKKQAIDTLIVRNEELKERKAAYKVKDARRLFAMTDAMPPSTRIIPSKTLSKLGPPAKEVLLAEGDSWFDYPFHHILRMLEDKHFYDVESVAHKGDRVEDMAYGGGQLEEFTHRLDKLLRNGIIPKAILLSGGGNDIAGEEFGMLLNHANSPIAGLNDNIIKGVTERLTLAYVTIIKGITVISNNRLNTRLPIIVHGYDYAIPDGRGFLGGWAFLPGPWLEPGFRRKGFSELPKRAGLVKQLMDSFNEMLETIISVKEFKHVHYINLRNTLKSSLSPQDNYREDWANELHPTKKGFEKITQKFADEVEKLPK